MSDSSGFLSRFPANLQGLKLEIRLHGTDVEIVHDPKLPRRCVELWAGGHRAVRFVDCSPSPQDLAEIAESAKSELAPPTDYAGGLNTQERKTPVLGLGNKQP